MSLSSYLKRKYRQGKEVYDERKAEKIVVRKFADIDT